MVNLNGKKRTTFCDKGNEIDVKTVEGKLNMPRNTVNADERKVSRNRF